MRAPARGRLGRNGLKHCLTDGACSEETPEVVPLGGSGYFVGFDPLDGSSIMAANFVSSP